MDKKTERVFSIVLGGRVVSDPTFLDRKLAQELGALSQDEGISVDLSRCPREVKLLFLFLLEELKKAKENSCGGVE